MITHRLPLEGTQEGFRLMATAGGPSTTLGTALSGPKGGENLKVVILPHG